MLPTQLEFEITQLLDGDLPPEKVLMVRRALDADPQAARLLQEHQRLDELLTQLEPVPEVDWNALSTDICRTIGAHQAKPLASWRPWRQLALAASILLALGMGMRLLVFQEPTPSDSAVAIVQVSGPERPSSTEQSIVQIKIGPAAAPPAIASFDQLPMASRASVVIATGRQPAQDTMLVALAR